MLIGRILLIPGPIWNRSDTDADDLSDAMRTERTNRTTETQDDTAIQKAREIAN